MISGWVSVYCVLAVGSVDLFRLISVATGLQVVLCSTVCIPVFLGFLF